MITCQEGEICELYNPCGYGNCSNSIDGFSCTCPDGFLQGEQNQQCQTCDTGFEPGIELGTCQDIDECENFKCGDGFCQNNIGGYNCICNEGFINAWNDKNSICGKFLGKNFEKVFGTGFSV